jgi:transposase
VFLRTNGAAQYGKHIRGVVFATWPRGLDSAVIIAELGVDMTVFQSASQLASWAGVCPGNNESPGKRKSSRIPKGNVYLKTALVEAANAAALWPGIHASREPAAAPTCWRLPYEGLA